MAHSINLQTTPVSTLNVREFASNEALQSAIKSAPGPILLVTSASELPGHLSILREFDDVCMEDAPDSLKSFRLDRLRRLAETVGPRKDCVDPLTQVNNRQAFLRLLRRSATSASPENPVSLLLCDIDHFKNLNDLFGHAAGDEMLCKIAKCFQSVAGEASAIGRLGGDEFAILCHVGNDGAKVIAQRLLTESANLGLGTGTSMTISLGLSSIKEPGSGSELLEKSDQALYAAKSAGRNRWTCINELESQSKANGNYIEVTGLENMARVLTERVTNMITMRSRKLLTHVREEADVDGLTGCFNRRYLDRRLASEFEGRCDAPLSVAFLDLDYFGQVNKSHGWSTGDKLLVEVCDTIRGEIRDGDWIGRYGGEEFCIVMPNTSADECENILTRIRVAVESTQFESARKRKPVPMTVSIGGTCAMNDDHSFCEMLERASEMALLAKNSGRNQVRMQCA